MSTFSNGVTPPASVFAEGVSPPASVFAECGVAPASSWARCGTGNEGPVLTAVSPSGELGTEVVIAITGENFDDSAVVAIAGITVTQTTFVDANTLLVLATIPNDAVAGAHATTVTTDNGTSNAVPFTVVEATPPVAETTPGDLRLWVEADFGVKNAAGDAAAAGESVAEWRDRSGYNHHLTPATSEGYTAPVFRASNFGGIANLPYLEFNDIHGLKTAVAAGLDLTSFAMMVVWYREAADSNSAFFWLTSDVIGLGVQDSAASSYLARWNTALHSALRESSYHTAFGWVPKSLRQLIEVQWDGATHAGHKQFLNGVQQAIASQINSIASPMVSSGSGRIAFGFRDSSLPQFNIQGRLAACVLISPKPSDADLTAWRTYLNGRWRSGTAPAPTPGRGPITVTATIDGVDVTVTVMGGSRQIEVIQFSQPIRKFEMTLPVGPSFPNYRVAFGCDGLSGAGTIEGGATAMGWDSTEGGVRKSMQFDAGFDTVVIENTLSGLAGGSGWDNARFWLVGDPL